LGVGIWAIIRAEFFKAFVEWIAKSFFRSKNIRKEDLIDDNIKRTEYEARQKEVFDGQREIRDLIYSSEDRIQAAFYGSVSEFKGSLNKMNERWDERILMLEKTFLDSRLKGNE